MITKFLDRKKELNELKVLLNSRKFEFLIMYGRRRIGKTALSLEATRKQKRIYYLAVGEKNLDRFYNICISHDKYISNLKKDWEVLFGYLKDKVDVIIIDEFQNMIKEDKNILHLFQSIVDNTLVLSRTKLFLLGSSISIITSKVMSYNSPLYGRRTASLKLKPVGFFDLREFYPDKRIDELIRIYGFADGIPFHLVRIENSFWKWLDRELNSEKSFLKDELDFLMRYEFEDTSTYKAVLEAISNGNTKLNEIKNFAGLKRTDISPYLKNLISVGFIKRVVPMTETMRSRMGRYYITDNFLKFWFRFVYPNLSAIEEGVFGAEYIKSGYAPYLGHVFEDVCHQYLIKKTVIRFNKIGKQWGKIPKAEKGRNAYEIDIVALNEKTKEILFAECKWKDRVNAEKILQELKEKAGYVQWNKGKRKEYYAVFAKSFSKRINEFEGKKAFCFDLDDMEKNL